jgi:hypothetical protein
MATAHRPHGTISIIHSNISITDNGYYKKKLQESLKQLNLGMQKAVHLTHAV